MSFPIFARAAATLMSDARGRCGTAISAGEREATSRISFWKQPQGDLRSLPLDSSFLDRGILSTGPNKERRKHQS